MRFKFEKTVAALMICVVMGSIVLVTAPPRIRFVQGINRDLIQNSNSRIILRLNQQIEKLNEAQVAIYPSAVFSVQTAGDRVYIDFSEPLKTNTDYGVTIRDVESKITRSIATLEHTFITKKYNLAYVERQQIVSADPYVDTKPSDMVYIGSLEGVNPKLLYEAPKIDQIVQLGDDILLSEIMGDKNHELRIVSQDGSVKPVKNVPGSAMYDLRGSSDGSIFGYRYTDKLNTAQDMKLAIYNTFTDTLFLPKTSDGKDFSVSEWDYSADSGLVAILDTEGNAWAIPMGDTTDSTYLGRFDRIIGFDQDGRELFMSRDGEVYSTQLESGDIGTLTIDIKSRSTELASLNGSGGFLVKRAGYMEAKDEFLSTVSAWDGMKSEIALLEVNSLKTSILSTQLSPNDQYLAVETSESSTAIYDDYISTRRPSNTTISIIDRYSGDKISDIRGVNPIIF